MTKTETIDITGMTCNHCVMKVTQALMAVNGVIKTSVNLEGKKAEVEYNVGESSAEKLIAAIEKAGYHGKKREE